jgi:hypothetical protein
VIRLLNDMITIACGIVIAAAVIYRLGSSLTILRPKLTPGDTVKGNNFPAPTLEVCSETNRRTKASDQERGAGSLNWFIVNVDAPYPLLPSARESSRTWPLADGGLMRKTAILVPAAACTVCTLSGCLSGDFKQNIKPQDYQAYLSLAPGGSRVISAAVAGISDASPTKRYEVYLPNGTYSDETIVTKDYVDIVGESEAGVIVQSSGTGLSQDTLYFNGTDTLVANMTVNHTLNSGAPYHEYPIHMDYSGNAPRTEVLYKVTANALGTYTPPGGTAVYGAIGIGVSGIETMYLIDVTAVSATMNGILAHNLARQSSPGKIYLINTTATSGALNGLEWQSIGSRQPDVIQVVGGAYSGPNFSIYAHNLGPPYAGAGEAYLEVDPSTTVSTISSTQHNIFGPVTNPGLLCQASPPHRLCSFF